MTSYSIRAVVGRTLKARQAICPSCQYVAACLLVTTGKSRAVFRASRARSEGRFAIVTKRWVRDAMDAGWRKDECADADDKAVWS